MTAPDTADLSATLAPIKDRAGVFAKLGPPRPALGFGSEIYNAAIASAGDVPTLVAALEAALQRHRPVIRKQGHPAMCEWDNRRWPCPEVRDITAALNGGTGG